jgi:P27 family predicted phage terminase small subunit
MAKQGRRAKPTHLKLIDGNPGKRPINEDEPIVAEGIGDPPTWLNIEQQDAWKFAVAHAPAGMLTALDRSALTIWVGAESMHRKALEAVNRYGLVTKSKNQGVPLQNPYLPIVNAQAKLMLSASAELGFSPSARSRVKIPESGRDRNPFEAFKK